MSVRFAPARCAARSPIARVLKRGAVTMAANDHEELEGFMSDTTKAALRHFAEYGLRAVPMAIRNAETAAAANQPEDYGYWLEICRSLDGAAARRIEASHQSVDQRLIG
ncbi:hypothetical protein [Erythrobacter sp. SD-21]|uniref:hypothetical protein n=1 Tax=Erythrobacter sp. SD-21 TaxID=161528 RepID=UPI000153F042|nr:hypothetical protein [Erythrobacter sp. SD-21]EDL50108.1 hypothetical protein ED21_26593 [Erythrobacter sp. SD-21]